MPTWPPAYYYWPYAAVRSDMMQQGMMTNGMQGAMMEVDQMRNMMAMMKEHMEMTKAIKETVDRIERRQIAMEKMMNK